MGIINETGKGMGWLYLETGMEINCWERRGVGLKDIPAPLYTKRNALMGFSLFT